MFVLVADRDLVVRRMLHDILAADGHSVIDASSSDVAVEMLFEGRASVAVVDWSLPDSGGLAVCRALAARPNAPFVYAIVTTSLQERRHTEEAFEAGACDVLMRPFGRNELCVRVRSALRMVIMREQLAISHSQKLETLGRLAAGIAHEIKAPLQYIGDNVRYLQLTISKIRNELIGRNADGAMNSMTSSSSIGELLDDGSSALDDTLKGIGRVTEIVRAVKGLSYPSVDLMALADVNEIVRNASAICRGEWNHLAELVLDLDPSLPSIPCRAGTLGQLIVNLIVNAAQAIGEINSGAKGTIKVTTAHDGPWIVIQVADTGPGIPVADREKMFDEFYTTKCAGVGTGQGLAIVRTVVEQHQGKLSFQTESGKGTTFFVRLPVEALASPATN